MKFVKQFKSGRMVQKLKSSRSMTAGALEQVQGELVATGSAAIGPLLECLSHGEARGPALDVLKRLLTDDTLDLFVEALSSPNPAIMSGVTKVLAEANTYDPTRILELLSDSSLPKSALEAVLWEQSAKIPPRRIVSMVPELAKDARAVIFRLLERCADASIIPDVINLSKHEDWWIRIYAAKLLGEHCNEKGVEALTLLLKDANKSVRLETVGSLHRLGIKEAIPDLTGRLRDPDLKVQSAAIDALIELGDDTSVPNLLHVLKDESEHARRAAVEVLNEVATPKAIQDLVKALRDADWWVRVRAADALGTLGGPKVVEATLGLLREQDDFLRRYAVEILNAIPSERAVEPLILTLSDTDWWVRERSIDALAKTGDGRAVEPLIEILESESTAAPLCARALGELKDVRAVDALCKAAVSDDEELQREAVAALTILSKVEITSEVRQQIGSVLSVSSMQPDRKKNMPLGVGKESPFGPEAARPDSGRHGRPRKKDEAEETPVAPAEGMVSPVKRPTGALNFTKLPKDTILLDRYRVIRPIGKGGFGAIYLVEDATIEEEIILKILNPQMSMDENAIRRFVQELKLTRKVTHKNVIRIYDFMDLGNAHAVSMEFFEGMDLNKTLKAEKKLSARRSLEICAQICEGLTAAHQENIVHRDIKPANILVNEDGYVKIVDFGLASAGQHVGSRLTKSGLLIGTPEYMAPEQISGDEVDHRADIYAVGIMLYEMLSGQKAFTADTPVKILFLHLEGEITPLGSLVEGLSLDVEYLVSCAMARNPEDRPESAEALLKMIQTTLAELTKAA